jgi:hypothetical protein
MLLQRPEQIISCLLTLVWSFGPWFGICCQNYLNWNTRFVIPHFEYDLFDRQTDIILRRYYFKEKFALLPHTKKGATKGEALTAFPIFLLSSI